MKLMVVEPVIEVEAIVSLGLEGHYPSEENMV
jgi:hypothetical protein